MCAYNLLAISEIMGIIWWPLLFCLDLAKMVSVASLLHCTTGHRRRNHGWKVGGDLKWGGCRSPSFSSSVPSQFSHYYSTPVSPVSFPTLLFSSPWNYSQKIWGKFIRLPTLSSEKRQSVGRDQMHSVHIVSELDGGDASHGSRRAAAPMLLVRGNRLRVLSATWDRNSICTRSLFLLTDLSTS